MFRTLSREFKFTSFISDALKKQSRSYAAVGGRRLVGKVALITGSASGLGKASAHEFIRHGAQVVIADRDTLLGPQVAKELGPSAHFVECDVADEAQVAEAVNVAIDLQGKLDIMYASGSSQRLAPQRLSASQSQPDTSASLLKHKHMVTQNARVLR